MADKFAGGKHVDSHDHDPRHQCQRRAQSRAPPSEPSSLLTSHIRRHELTSMIGTTRFMAPELIEASLAQNARVAYGGEIDVFSFGIMMYSVAQGLSDPYPESGFGTEVEEEVLAGRRSVTTLVILSSSPASYPRRLSHLRDSRSVRYDPPTPTEGLI